MDATTGGLRILVVDDGVDSARLLSRFVTMLGHEVRTAYDGTGAVESASEFRPDVVVMDIGLPSIDGCEAARRIRWQPWGTGVKLIALTVSGQVIDGRRLREAGFDHHLPKPVDAEALVTLIGRSKPPSG